jgi:hypothetical protein
MRSELKKDPVLLRLRPARLPREMDAVPVLVI